MYQVPKTVSLQGLKRFITQCNLLVAAKIPDEPSFQQWFLKEDQIDTVVKEIALKLWKDALRQPRPESVYVELHDSMVRDLETWSQKEAPYHWIDRLATCCGEYPHMDASQLQPAMAKESAIIFPASRVIKPLRKPKPLSDFDKELLDLAGANGPPSTKESPANASGTGKAPIFQVSMPQTQQTTQFSSSSQPQFGGPSFQTQFGSTSAFQPQFGSTSVSQPQLTQSFTGESLPSSSMPQFSQGPLPPSGQDQTSASSSSKRPMEQVLQYNDLKGKKKARQYDDDDAALEQDIREELSKEPMQDNGEQTPALAQAPTPTMNPNESNLMLKARLDVLEAEIAEERAHQKEIMEEQKETFEIQIMEVRSKYETELLEQRKNLDEEIQHRQYLAKKLEGRQDQDVDIQQQHFAHQQELHQQRSQFQYDIQQQRAKYEEELQIKQQQYEEASQQQQHKYQQELEQQRQIFEQQKASLQQEAEAYVKQQTAHAESQLADSEKERYRLDQKLQELSEQVKNLTKALKEAPNQKTESNTQGTQTDVPALTGVISVVAVTNPVAPAPVAAAPVVVAAAPTVSSKGTQTEYPSAAPSVLPPTVPTPPATAAPASGPETPSRPFPYAAILGQVKTLPAALYRPREGGFRAPKYDYDLLSGKVEHVLRGLAPSSLPLADRLVALLTFLTWDEAGRSPSFGPLREASGELADNVKEALAHEEEWTDESVLSELGVQIAAVQAATKAHEECHRDFWARPECTLDTVPEPTRAEIAHGWPVSFKVGRAAKHLEELRDSFQALATDFDLGPLYYDRESPFLTFLAREVGPCQERLAKFDIVKRRRALLGPGRRPFGGHMPSVLELEPAFRAAGKSVRFVEEPTAVEEAAGLPPPPVPAAPTPPPAPAVPLPPSTPKVPASDIAQPTLWFPSCVLGVMVILGGLSLIFS